MPRIARHRGRSLWYALVVLLAPGDLPGQGRRDPPEGNRYAFLVGVGRYDSDQARDLPFAERDVTELARVLRGRGYRAADVVLLTDGAGAEDPRYRPVLANIRKEFQALLHRCHPPDLVLVALSGHGEQFRGHKEQYFLPRDADPDDPASFLSITDLYQDLADCAAAHKLLLVDACRGDSRDPPPLEAGGGRGKGGGTRPGLSVPRGGAAALFGCSRGQASMDHDDLKHSVFFHFVIEGLKGAAADRDRRVTLPSLKDYVTRNVPDYVRSKYEYSRQVPEGFGDWPATIPLVSPEAPGAGPEDDPRD